MPKICYQPKKFARDTLAIIELSEKICVEYAQKGYDLTLRQLYYQLVTRNVFANTEQSYKRLGSIISDARRAGCIDWRHIVDRTRNLRQESGWSGPAEIIEATAEQYRTRRWKGQPIQVEAWIEKDALVGVLEVAADEFSLPHFSCRGYCSDSEMWSAALRIRRRATDHKQSTIILHLGDHDPSGIDMTRDIIDRLELFSGAEPDGHAELGPISRFDRQLAGTFFQVRRIALTREQIEEYDPPPNPAKTTDARFRGYQRKHGDESWELDALDPETITDLVLSHTKEVIVDSVWAETMKREEADRARLNTLAKLERLREEALQD